MRPPTPLPRVHIPPRLLSLACSAESAQQSTFHPPKATALRRMSQRFWNDQSLQPLLYCTRPLSSSSSPRQRRQVVFIIIAADRDTGTNHQRTDSFRFDQPTVLSVELAQVLRCVLCASTSPRCVSSTKSRAVFCPSHQFLLREHESSEEIATRFDTQHASIQHNTGTEENACVRSACDEAPMSSVSSFLPAHAVHPSANLALHEVLSTGCYVCSALSS